MNFKEVQKNFAEWGYILEKHTIVTGMKYKAYRQDGMFSTLYAADIVTMINMIEDLHMEKF